MNKVKKLPERERRKLKRPYGELFENSEKAFKHVDSSKPEELITVGLRFGRIH